MDLSASRLNKQLPLYVSYRPDPAAYAVDAISLSWKDMVFLCFSSFQSHYQSAPESMTGGEQRRCGGPSVANAGVVANADQDADWPSSCPQKEQGSSVSPQPTRHGSPSVEPQELHPVGMLDITIRQCFQERGYSAEAAGLMIDSWRPATQEAYNCYIKKWKTYVPLSFSFGSYTCGCR